MKRLVIRDDEHFTELLRAAGLIDDEGQDYNRLGRYKNTSIEWKSRNPTIIGVVVEYTRRLIE